MEMFEKLCIEIINKCREYALSRYSPEVFSDKLEGVYFQLVGEK